MHSILPIAPPLTAAAPAQVRGKAVARVTGLVLGRGAPAPPAAATASGGGGGGSQRGGGRGAQGGGGGAAAAASGTPAGDPAVAEALLASLSKPKAGAAAGSGGGGAAALQVLASQLLQQLVACRADVTPGGDDGDARASASAALAPDIVALGHTLGSLVARLPALHPQRDLRPPVTDIDVVDAHGRAAQLEAALAQAKCSGCGRWPLQWGLYSRVQQLESALAAVRKKYSIEALALYPEMWGPPVRSSSPPPLPAATPRSPLPALRRQSRLGLLRDLGYTQLGDAPMARRGASGDEEEAVADTAMDVVKLKGRVAAEVNTCDELM